ncbi:hypothetical protein PHJA_001373000 [Phtheirospermum japonicum]|uniref:Uncharacterized protein n=1 Tax=Phtheirospermum japonicum TaxID=374723 RepID=A0A830C002_9LAMI|nr:hypothetical protein PHJA_001373000 [Phtheirospermum japonicum]
MIHDLCIDNVKTKTRSSIPTSPVVLREALSVKRNNCLCSPTTHAGLFRCSHHRTHPPQQYVHRIEALRARRQTGHHVRKHMPQLAYHHA